MKKVDLSKFGNKNYFPGNRIVIIFWYFINQLIFKTFLPFPSKFKAHILRFFGSRIGENIVIKPNVNIKYPWNLIIGNNCWIGENVWIDNLAKITICDNVCISQGAMLLCGNHNYKSTEFDLIVKPIILEDGVWVGAKSIVCPGVTLKSHSILSVGSVANHDLQSYSIYKGNPALKVKDRLLL